jgi:signal transduction histidine kinase
MPFPDAIISSMDRTFRPIHTGGDADIAFAVVVLAAYFTTFSLLKSATTLQLLILIALGVAYITIGIYGYAYVARSGKVGFHILYFVIQLVLGGSIVSLAKGNAYSAMVLLPLAGHSVVLLPRNLRMGVNVAIVLTYAITLDLLAMNWSLVWSGLPIFLAGQIFIIVFTQMAVSEERARGEIEKLYKELEGANNGLREYALKSEELAISKERNRLAREIHDGLGHYLTTVFMQIQAARAVMRLDPQKAMDALGTAQNLTQEALIDVRRSVAALRDSPGDSLALQEEITKMLKNCEGSGIHTNLEITGSPRTLSHQTIFTLYRAVQEGINNTCKHAHASCFDVQLDYSDEEKIKLHIRDDGVGAEQFDGGFGLLGMRERVHMLNGDLSISTAPGNGFILDVYLPG